VTVQTTTNKALFTGPSITGPFTFNFRFFDNADIEVIRTTISTGAETTLTEGGGANGYTLTGAGNYNGGSVTLNTALVEGSQILTVRRVLDVKQGTALRNQGSYFAELHEDMADRNTMVDQQQDEQIARSLQLQVSSDLADPVIPETYSAVTRALKGIGFDALGNLKLYVLQAGASLIDLAASTGASLIGFLQSGAGAVLQTVQDHLRSLPISVKNFGVTGDGTDETTKFQAALAAAGNRDLLLAPGATYVISDTLSVPAGCRIKGNGATITNNITGQGNVFQIAASNVSIENLTINNTANNPTYTVSDPSYYGASIFINGTASAVRNVTLENITINRGITYAGGIVGIGNVENVLVDNCTVDAGSTTGTFVSCFEFEWYLIGGLVISPKNILLRNCTAKDNNDLGGDYNFGYWVSACSRVTLENCKAVTCLRGYSLHTGDQGQQVGNKISIVVDNCHAYDIKYQCIQTFFNGSITPPSNDVVLSIRNCHLRGLLKTESGCYGIEIQSARGPVRIENSIIENVSRGIFAGSTDTQNVSNIHIVGNKFYDINGAPIIGYGVTDSVIAQNRFYDVNQGSTASVADSAVYLTYQSDRNVITQNVFGLGTAQSRFYVTLYPAGSPLLIPTRNVVTENTFVLATVGGANVINNTGAETGLCANIVQFNVLGNSDAQVSGAEVYRPNVKFGTGSFGTDATDGRLTAQSATSNSSSEAIYLKNAAGTRLLSVRGDGLLYTGTAGASPYNNTTAAAANLLVTATGEIQRSTSSLKYKKNVQDAVHGLAEVLKLRPVIYQGKSEADGDAVFGGLVAEEVHEVGLTEFVQYAPDGSPDALSYGPMVSLAFKAIQEQQAEIQELRRQVADHA
jgi:hypothetical protein